MKNFIIVAVLLVVFCSAPGAFAEDVKTQTGESPLKLEMILLDNAFKNLISSLVLNNLNAVEEPFHNVHAAREKTEEAIKKGQIVLPKNNDRMKEFIELDEKFHHKLEALIKASKKGDMKKVQQSTYDLLNACVHCHQRFNK